MATVTNGAPNGASGNGKLTRKDFASPSEVRWCPGCGDYSIISQVQKVLADSGASRENTVFVSGIGCSSRMPYYMNTYGFHTIHGRAPAIASGLKISRPDLSVWIVTGDGDALAIGGNHFIHALRRNLDVKILLFNNKIYGLTKGQYSPTSDTGTRAKSTPYGSLDRPFNPVQLALGAGASFVARSSDTDPAHLQSVLLRAAAHKGSAFVEIMQNCVVFNDGVWAKITDKDKKVDEQVRIEHGKPYLFAGGKKALQFNGVVPEIVNVGEGAMAEYALTKHDEKGTTAFAFALAELNHPMPLGVFRIGDLPSYDALDTEQRKAITAQKGKGNLSKLLRSGDTWRVDA